MIATIERIASPSETLIQMGDNTHHQLQLITLHSFSPMNRIVRAPVKLSPPEDEDDVLDVIVWLDQRMDYKRTRGDPGAPGGQFSHRRECV